MINNAKMLNSDIITITTITTITTNNNLRRGTSISHCDDSYSCSCSCSICTYILAFAVASASVLSALITCIIEHFTAS